MRETAVWITRRSFLIGATATTGCALLDDDEGSAPATSGARERSATAPAAPDADSTVLPTVGARSGSFGATVSLGALADVETALADTPMLYISEAQMYLVRVDQEWREPLKAVTGAGEHGGIDSGFTALYQKCPHLGCRVPECAGSGQFECPCHGSLYGPLGEKRGGPAPRGMDRFPVLVDDGEVFVETGTLISGLPIGTELGETIEAACVSEDELS